MKNQENVPENIRAAGRKLPFEVPESYFDSLPERIQDRLSEAGSSRRPAIIRTLRPKLAMAAMFIGLITVGYLGVRIITNTGNPLYLSEDEINETLEDFAYDLDNEMLISAMMESDLILSVDSEDPQTDEIIRYLSEEDIDFGGLLNEY